MSRNTTRRCREAQRYGVVALGAAALLASTASGAGAATGVVIPLAPGEVILEAFPVENLGPMDPMADPNFAGTSTPVNVRYTGTITVNLPVELDDSAVEADLEFDDNGDGVPEATYSSSLPPADPNFLTVSGQGTGSITVTLPADDPAVGDVATLFLAPLTTNLSSAFTHLDPVYYDLEFDAAAPAAVTVDPALLAVSQVPCNLTSGTRCTFPTPVTAGSSVALDLTAGSVLRELGIADLTGVQVGLQQLDASGNPVNSTIVELPVQVTGTGSTASFTVPAGTAAGFYSLLVAQSTPSGGVSILGVEITIVAPAAAAAPTTAVNAGLRSNTGVEVVETGSTGNVPVAMGAGLLLLAGAGGVAVARTRRRPAAEGGTCES